MNHTIIRSLPIPLSDEKKARFAEQLAADELKLAAKKDEKKETVAGFNSVIDGIQESIDRVAGIIDQGTELADIPCEWRLDHAADRKYLHRLDNDEQVETQGLTEEDRQLSIPNLVDAFSPIPENETTPEPDTQSADHGTFINSRYRGLRKKKAVM